MRALSKERKTRGEDKPRRRKEAGATAIAALEPSAFAVPTKGSEGPDAVFACDARGTALVPTDAAAPPARVLDAGCVQGLVGEGAGWRVFFVDATHSATPELYAATATNLSDAATYEIDGVVLRGDPGAWDAGGIASATDVVALANGSVQRPVAATIFERL